VTITSGYSKVINNGVASGVCVPAARFVFTELCMDVLQLHFWDE